MEKHKTLTFDREDFQKRKQKLDETRTVLKTEFHGIDDVIDQVVDTVSGWYCFNVLQNKPLVVNLWGLTGTGKTSLVKRLVYLLELENLFFKYDMRNSSVREFDDICNSLHKKFKEAPFVLILDEFQQGKSIDEDNKSSTNPHQSKIWELLDSGEITIGFNYRTVENLIVQIDRCQQILTMGADVIKGKMKFRAKGQTRSDGISSRNIITKRQYVSGVRIEDGDSFVEENYLDDICDLSEFESEFQVKDHLETMNGPQTLAYLNELLKTAFKPREIDATKGLIFVAGNLDQAFRMSSRLSGEEDADEFYKASRNITLTDIKNALSSLFRKEQISRLGNIHVIYPSLNKRAYELIIARELELINNEFKALTSLSFDFDQSLKNKIYEEGVIPSQGTRPVFSVIQYMVRAYLPKVMDEIMTREIEVNKLRMGFDKKQITLAYHFDDKLVHQTTFPFYSNLDTIRSQRNTDERYIVAVHEAGHLLSSICLLQMPPKRATSLSISGHMEGFVVLSKPKTYFHKDVLNWVAVNLAGGVAEKLIFGDDHLPFGTYSDYAYATAYIIDLIKGGVLNEVPGIYKHQDIFTDSFLSDHSQSFDHEAEKWLLNGQRVCKELLESHERELLELADRLLKVDYMEEHEIRTYAEQKLGWKPTDQEQGKGVYAAYFERRRKEIIGLDRIGLNSIN